MKFTDAEILRDLETLNPKFFKQLEKMNEGFRERTHKALLENVKRQRTIALNMSFESAK